jgi:hypothetical protein
MAYSTHVVCQHFEYPTNRQLDGCWDPSPIWIELQYSVFVGIMCLLLVCCSELCYITCVVTCSLDKKSSEPAISHQLCVHDRCCARTHDCPINLYICAGVGDIPSTVWCDSCCMFTTDHCDSQVQKVWIPSSGPTSETPQNQVHLHDDQRNADSLRVGMSSLHASW